MCPEEGARELGDTRVGEEGRVPVTPLPTSGLWQPWPFPSFSCWIRDPNSLFPKISSP